MAVGIEVSTEVATMVAVMTSAEVTVTIGVGTPKQEHAAESEGPA